MKRLSFATLWLLVLSGGGLWAAPSATPARKNLYDLSNYMESTDKRLPGPSAKPRMEFTRCSLRPRLNVF